MKRDVAELVTQAALVIADKPPPTRTVLAADKLPTEVWRAIIESDDHLLYEELYPPHNRTVRWVQTPIVLVDGMSARSALAQQRWKTIGVPEVKGFDIFEHRPKISALKSAYRSTMRGYPATASAEDDEMLAAMRGPADLPADTFVNIARDGHSFFVEYTAQDRRTQTDVKGGIELERADEECGSYYQVVNSEADHGWGPLLYDVAMEVAYPRGVISDRATISKAAQKVWYYYFRNRPDVSKDVIEGDCPSPVWGEPFDYAYYKKPKLIHELKKLGKLIGDSKSSIAASTAETTAALLAECKKLGIGGRANIGGVSVGKKMGTSTYVHRDYQTVFPGVEEAAAKLPEDFDYTVVKHDSDSGCFSFVQCADFDTAPEPTVGDSARVCGEKVTQRPAGDDPMIYHHKWTMVGDDYEGFDVAESMKRSIAWKSIVGKDSALSSRIGKKSVWEKEVLPRLKT